MQDALTLNLSINKDITENYSKLKKYSNLSENSGLYCLDRCPNEYPYITEKLFCSNVDLKVDSKL